MIGGTGTDTLALDKAATVDLSASTISSADTETISVFENVTGSAFADTITGDSGVNVISGQNGNDIIDGGAGNDTLYGNGGTDTVVYETATSSVFLRLGGYAASGGGGTDKVYSFENGIGSDYGDTLWGNSGSNVFLWWRRRRHHRRQRRRRCTLR